MGALRQVPTACVAHVLRDRIEWRSFKSVNRRDFLGFKKGSSDGDARTPGEAHARSPKFQREIMFTRTRGALRSSQKAVAPPGPGC